MPTRLQFDFDPHPKPAPRAGSVPMRLLVLGDFSARPAAERTPLAGRAVHRVDAERFDEVMRRLAPRLALGGTSVEFDGLDSLHADALLARLPLFTELRRTRQQLQDPARFAQAAAALGAAPAAAAASGPAAAGGDLLASLIGGRPPGAASPAPAAASAAGPASGVDAFIRGIVAPHVVPDHGAQQAALLKSVDDAIASELRMVLHEPAFQALEACWRGLHWLCSSLETDESLQLHLVDISRDELLADLVAAQGRISDTGLHRLLAERWPPSPGGAGGGSGLVLTTLYDFGPSDADIGLLAALGLLAAQAGAPLLAAGQTALALAEPAALAGWQRLRGSEAARWISLAAPRVLLRRPYGRRSEPLQGTAFEEFTGTPDHEDWLWGPGSLAVALLLGRAFMANGWSMTPGDEREIGDLPACTVLRDGELELQPCAEAFLSESALHALMDAGLTPLASHRHRNALTAVRIQSIAQPAQALAGLGGA
jgi:type VI secretion system protein ImpC